MSAPLPAISFDAVTFGFDQPVLSDISFSISMGECIGIIGPNGGGKTTLLKLMMGFLTPHQGNITLFGKSPQSASKCIGYVPQSLRFDRQFPLSVLELVLMGRLASLPWWGHYSANDIAIASAAMARVNLSGFEKRPFSTLSGGEMQRALIARALAGKPEILILDEPTASVDPGAEQMIHDILTELRRSMTICMVTHDLDAAIHLFDRILCVRRQVTSLAPELVCEHFAYGLYHTPLLSVGNEPKRGDLR